MQPDGRARVNLECAARSAKSVDGLWAERWQPLGLSNAPVRTDAGITCRPPTRGHVAETGRALLPWEAGHRRGKLEEVAWFYSTLIERVSGLPCPLRDISHVDYL